MDRQEQQGFGQNKEVTTIRNQSDLRSEQADGECSDLVSSLGEMMVLQEVSVLISTDVKEWQYKDILNDIGQFGVGGSVRRVVRAHV